MMVFMSSFAICLNPDVSVPEIERRAKANIVKGWKRQQKYRHSDGSYSIWGPKDEGAEVTKKFHIFISL